MPNLGIIASSNQQGRNVDTGAMFPLQVITVGSAGASSVTFSNIPSTYTHLQIRGICTVATTDQYLKLQVNSDTGSNYKTHYLSGNGTTASAYVPSSTTNLEIFGKSYAVSDTYPTAIITDILDYKDTNKYKTFRTLNGNDRNGSGEVGLESGLWMSTSAITSIKIYADVNLSQYSQFALYGIKAAF